MSPGCFTPNSKRYIYHTNDTLFLWSLGSDQPIYVNDVISFKQTGAWLAYLLKDSGLILHNLSNDRRQQFRFISDYAFDKTGSVLLLKTIQKQKNTIQKELVWVDLINEQANKVWSVLDSSEYFDISNFCFDDAGTQLAFIINKQSGKDSENTIWHYKSGMSTSYKLLSNQLDGIASGLKIGDYYLEFSSSGNCLFFNLKDKNQKKNPTPDATKVDIWSYGDDELQSTQLLAGSIYFSAELKIVAVANLANKRVNVVSDCDERILAKSSAKNDYVIVRNKVNTNPHEYWRSSYLDQSIYLVSLRDGSRKLLDKGNTRTDYEFSPAGRYFICYNSPKKQYQSYDLMTEETVNISQQVNATYDFGNFGLGNIGYIPGMYAEPFGIAGWIKKKTVHSLFTINMIFGKSTHLELQCLFVLPTSLESLITLNYGWLIIMAIRMLRKPIYF